jgi:hypothetical protein
MIFSRFKIVKGFSYSKERPKVLGKSRTPSTIAMLQEVIEDQKEF